MTALEDQPARPTIPRAPRIGVMGPRECTDEASELAEATGRRIAQAGAILICGGGSGVMESASRGAAEEGGLVIGILPSEDATSANPYVTVPIVTGMGNARNVINVLTSHALIAVSGGPGTLSEIALALKVGTPVVGLGTWDCAAPPGPKPPASEIHLAEDPLDAVSQALALARTRAADSGFDDRRLY